LDNLKSKKEYNFFSNDEIDLFDFAKFFIRNKVSILKFSIIFTLLGVFQSFNIKKVWEGDFQIVLESNGNDNAELLTQNSPLILSALNNTASSLETEVEILKSPLALSEAFDFVKERKQKAEKENSSQLDFFNWRDSALKIDLKKNTSVLNLSYKDTNKDNIIPVLEKISRDYQKYSGQKRLRNIELGIEFFKKQIEKYTLKSENLSKQIQDFSSKYDLAISDKNFDNNELLITNVEEARIDSRNLIRNINLQLNQIDNMGEEESLSFILNVIYQGEKTSTILAIDGINTKLAYYKSIYVDTDNVILNLEKRKTLYIDILKSQAKSYLKSIIESQNSILNSSKRPKGTIFQYKQLLKEVVKNDKTLKNLEVNYSDLLLEEARFEDPWQLITSPTLKLYPVSPGKITIVINSLILGLTVSIIYNAIFENIKGKIFNYSKLREILNKTKLLKLIHIGEEGFDENFQLLLSNKIFENNKEIYLLILGNIPDFIRINIDNYNKNNLANKQIKLISSFKELHQLSKFSLLIKLGAINKTALLDCVQKCKLSNKEIESCIVIEEKS
tara:strand:+ start:2067 stop:3746 length:1680 start_codon:yes stop_codon:yes gene_type:complete